MIKRNLRDFVNDMENFSGTLVVPRDANIYNVGDEQNGIDLNSMIRRNLRDFDLNSMIARNLCDFVNAMESFNGPLFVARDANFDNMGGQQNDLFADIDDDHAIPRVGINPDEFTQTLQNVPDVCQQASFANDEMVCDNVHKDMTSTREMVSPGFGHQNTGCLDDVNCDARHDYDIGIKLAQMLNLYQTGSYEMKCDEHFISFDSDVNRISSEPRYAGNMSLISTCSYTENVGFTNDFDNFRVVKLISIFFTWPQVPMNFICILAMIIRVNFSYTKFRVSSSVSVIRKKDTARKSTSLIHGTVVQQGRLFVSDLVELWDY